jgi:hypothetical protein
MLRLLLCLSLISLEVFACTEPGNGFFPENNRRYPVNFKAGGLTREQYDAAIDKVFKVYSPIVKRYGAHLQIERKWESETVNAGTLRRNEGKTWVLNLYGGFARHPAITPDGYMLVICHEIGHHIGGAPKKRFEGTGIHWASTEGQSDYFANLKCLRKVFAKDNNEEVISQMDVPDSIRTECTKAFPSAWEAAICIRTTIAGISVGKVNADIRRLPAPDIDVVDSSIVSSTLNAHPVPQCRLNTYFQASLCTVPSTRSVSQFDDKKGTCHSQLGYTVGLRPACWYKAP